MRNVLLKKWLLYSFLVVVLFLGINTNANAAIVKTGHQKYSYKEYIQDINDLLKKYPGKMQVNKIGTTPDKRDLLEVVIGNPEAKKHLLVIANLHAREYMTTQLCMKQIEYYLQNYDRNLCGGKVADTVNNVCIHYIPSCNPDGTAISQYGFGAIRDKKLRKALKKMKGGSRTWKSNARGVDLNRNWNVAFKKKGKAGSQGYHGKKAASEPETKALVNWVNATSRKGKVVGVISYHSTGSILYGRCAGGVTSYVRSQTNRMSTLAKNLTGYGLMPAESKSSASGCSREYFLYVKKIPCITLEIGRGSCPLKGGEFSSIWYKNKNMVLRQAMLFK